MKPLRYSLAVLSLCVACPGLAEKQRLELSGQLFLDADYYGSFWSKDGDNSNTEAQVRRARFQLDYDFPRGWLAKLQADGEMNSDDSDLELGSAYLRYTRWDFADITLGKMKEPLGLEQNTAAARLMTIEGAMMTTAFTPGWASALEVSMDLIRAWACGLRNTMPCSNPLRFMSAPYCARPVTLSTPSGRIGRLPTTLNSTSDILLVGKLEPKVLWTQVLALRVYLNCPKWKQ